LEPRPQGSGGFLCSKAITDSVNRHRFTLLLNGVPDRIPDRFVGEQVPSTAMPGPSLPVWTIHTRLIHGPRRISLKLVHHPLGFRITPDDEMNMGRADVGGE
jgi:hypothetical protein